MSAWNLTAFVTRGRTGSQGIGSTVNLFLPVSATHFLSSLLFVVFGVQLLRTAWSMESKPGGGGDAVAEVEEELDAEGIDLEASSACAVPCPALT